MLPPMRCCGRSIWKCISVFEKDKVTAAEIVRKHINNQEEAIIEQLQLEKNDCRKSV